MAHTPPLDDCPPNSQDAQTRPEPGARRGDRAGGGRARGFFFTISDRTDLRTGVSGAKFDARADFEVHLPPAPPKPSKNIEKRREIFEKKK